MNFQQSKSPLGITKAWSSGPGYLLSTFHSGLAMPKALIREPLVWFVIIGSVIFILKNLWTEKPVDYQIRITEKDVSRIRSQWEAQSAKPLSEKDLNSLIDSHVREEMLYREAVRLGLDQNDVIIRRLRLQTFHNRRS